MEILGDIPRRAVYVPDRNGDGRGCSGADLYNLFN
jgi:hypothetical protein